MGELERRQSKREISYRRRTCRVMHNLLIPKHNHGT
jgi:hypothetical protein